MNILLDTNILTALEQDLHPMNAVVSTAVSELKNKDHVLCIVPQNVYEFWSVATRPVSGTNGLGLNTAEVDASVTRIRNLFTLVPDSPAIYTRWLGLVKSHDVKGRNAHDARLVAAMIAHNITHIFDAECGRFQSLQRDYRVVADTGRCRPISSAEVASARRRYIARREGCRMTDGRIVRR